MFDLAPIFYKRKWFQKDFAPEEDRSQINCTGMNCVKHNMAAVGICTHCGRAMCTECIPSPPPARLTCSPECAIALSKAERGLESLLQKSAQSAKGSALYYYLGSGLSAGASVAAHYNLPSPFLIWFTAACAVVLLVMGLWYTRISRKSGV